MPTDAPRYVLAPADGPSARSLVLAVLTLHVVPDGGAAWTGSLVEALGLLGVHEKSCRQVIRRLRGEGWLEPERQGRRTRLRLTDHAHAQMQRQQHVARFEAAATEDEWLLLLLPPEPDGRDSRRRLRRTLASFGWGNVAPGTWLTNGTASRPAVVEVLVREGLDQAATFVRAEFLGPRALEDLVARTWDFPELARHYELFLRSFERLSPRSDAEAFAARVRMTEMWIRTFRRDPFLPAAYLPARWLGTKARRVMNQQMARWEAGADRYWHAITSRRSDS